MADKADSLVIEIPSDAITIGHDPDGLPKTVAVEPPAREELGPVVEAKDNTAELEALRREREDLARERDAKAAEAAEHAKQLATERAARLAAEEQSGKSTEFGWRAHWAKVNAEAESIASGLGTTKEMLATAERELQAASEAGEHSRFAEITTRIGRLSNTLGELERGQRAAAAEIEDAKQRYAAYAETQKTPIKKDPEPEVKKEPEPKQLSPEEWMRQFPRKTQGWLRDHKDYALGGAKHGDLVKFANEWIEDYGAHTLHSPQFLEHMNQHFNPSEGDEMADEPVREAPKTKAKAVPAAPVSRGGQYFSSRNPNAQKIQLPPDVAAFVKASGLDATKYALQVHEDIRKGLLPKEWLDPDFDRGIR